MAIEREGPAECDSYMHVWMMMMSDERAMEYRKQKTLTTHNFSTWIIGRGLSQ